MRLGGERAKSCPYECGNAELQRPIKKGLTMRRLRASIRPCARLPYDRRPTRHVGAHERREVGCTHSGGCGALALELRAQLGIIKGRADRRIEPIGERG